MTTSESPPEDIGMIHIFFFTLFVRIGGGTSPREVAARLLTRFDEISTKDEDASGKGIKRKKGQSMG
jgi:hypothetical protein